ASRGIRGSETETIRTPGRPARSAITVSPLPVNAIPRQSKPGPRFEVDPGAYAVARGTPHDTTDLARFGAREATCAAGYRPAADRVLRSPGWASRSCARASWTA